MDKRILAVVAAIIVVVAGIGAYLVTSGGSEESENVDIQASLSICGNANGDHKIDGDDVAIIKDIVDKKLNAEDHPLADANHDGEVDEKDVDFVQSMIKKTNTHLYVYDDKGQFVKVNYPVTKSVVVGTNALTTAILVGMDDFILGYSSTSYPEIHKPVIQNSKRLGGTILDMNTDEAISNFMKLDADCGGLDVVIALPTCLRTSASLIEKAEIPIVRLDTRFGWDSISGALTMGYMCGVETEKRSQEFAEMTFSYLTEIEKKLGDVATKKTYLAVAAGSNIGQLDSAYNKVCDYAGGSPVAKLPGTTAESIEIGSEGYKNYHPDNIISFRTLDYSINFVHAVSGKVTTPESEWKSYQKYWEDMDCYKDLYYVNLAMPVIAQIAYVAEIFYPDIFGEGYGDKVHQDVVDNFMEYLGEDFDVSKDMTTVFGYDDIFN